MKVRSRLSLILCTGIAAVILLSLLLNFFINKETQKLLTEKLVETETQNAPKALDFQGANLKNFAFDYSIWDPMVAFMKKKPDTAWFDEEVVTPVSLHNLDYVWIIDTTGKEHYSTSTQEEKELLLLDIEPSILKKQLYADYFKHFFIKHAGEIVELYAGPIQPNADTARKSKPAGFLLFGRKVDAEYFARLHDIAGEINISLAGTTTAYEKKVESGSVQFSVPVSDIEGNTIAHFNVSKGYPLLVSYRKYLLGYVISFIIIVALFGMLFFQISRKMLFRPLYSITSALAEKSLEKIKGLSRSKTEYGELSKLVIDFFEQNKLLTKEIDTRKETELALNRSMKEKEQAITDKIKAEQTTIAKSEFLSTMSHEIRTPINGVIGISNLLLDEKMTEKQLDYVKTLNFSAQHLLSLVSDILDFSKIESGKLQLEKTSFNLEKVCSHVFDLYKSKAEEKGISYTFKPAPVDTFSLYGDPTRLSQILSNLLSNAIKFTDKGSVNFSYVVKEKSNASVELSYSLREDNNHRVVIAFTIKDSGIGIPEESQHKIFDSFSQADKSTTREYGGSGLGLTICKKLVDLHGGSIVVNSSPGNGSEFSVIMPFDKHVYTDKDALEKNKNKTFNDELGGMKILVAEDNHINAMVLTRFLHKWKAEFKVAKDGQQAVDMIKNEKFDVVLMDLQMPVMDGMEATETIRMSGDDSINKIPIVAFTADALIENHTRLLKMGFDHCLTKPFNPEVLLKFLKKYNTNAA